MFVRYRGGGVGHLGTTAIFEDDRDDIDEDADSEDGGEASLRADSPSGSSGPSSSFRRKGPAEDELAGEAPSGSDSDEPEMGQYWEESVSDGEASDDSLSLAYGSDNEEGFGAF
ncbi:hypothetical protein BD626DRAFT_526681 [Schizophyllum amplum]|uniref:Uncharacterized protein n=1 Tax=Schizophyllum amplum TaxID=97359 RepID=A0A550BSB9_9AGAR|nr:hypothetical protein BD626DRAFT_526681 [Auriculariopsis ampla]